MKIKDGFVMREVAGQNVAIATGEASKTFHGMVKLNATGARIWQGIVNGETVEEIATSLADTYQVSQEQAAQDVVSFVQKMKDQGLVE